MSLHKNLISLVIGVGLLLSPMNKLYAGDKSCCAEVNSVFDLTWVSPDGNLGKYQRFKQATLSEIYTKHFNIYAQNFEGEKFLSISQCDSNGQNKERGILIDIDAGKKCNCNKLNHAEKWLIKGLSQKLSGASR